MNKYERRVKGKAMYLRRLANYRLAGGTNTNNLRNTGKPCSCALCSPAKLGGVRASVQRKIDKSNLIQICDFEIRARQINGYKYLIP